MRYFVNHLYIYIIIFFTESFVVRSREHENFSNGYYNRKLFFGGGLSGQHCNVNIRFIGYSSEKVQKVSWEIFYIFFKIIFLIIICNSL